MNGPIPPDEIQRLSQLREYAILDTPSEKGFDEVVQLAAQICGTPVSLISLIDEHRQWFKARHGIETAETPREHAFCAHTICDRDHLFVVPDATGDERFRSNPLVTGELGLRFYAGAPLVTPSGHVLGALCVIDRKPRQLTPEQAMALRALSNQVVAQLELRRALMIRQREAEQLRLTEQALKACSEGIVITDARLPDHPVIMVNPAFERITGYSAADAFGKNCRFLQKNDRIQPGLKTLRSALRQKKRCRVVLRNYRKDGRAFWNELHLAPIFDEAGKITHFVGIQSDITARKEAEDALRQRDAILEGVSYATETLLHATDLESALPAALEQLGTATGCDHLSIWQEERRPGAVPCLGLRHVWSSPKVAARQSDALESIPWDESCGWPTATTLRNGQIIQGSPESCSEHERELLKSLGVAYFITLPIFTGPGQFWGVMSLDYVRPALRWGFVELEAMRSATRVLGALIHDRQTDAALRASEERFRSVVNSLKEVVFQTDAAGLWTFLNPAWMEITGYSVEESIGTLFLDYVHPDDRERNTRLFGPLIRREKEYCRHEVRYLTKDGGYCWIEVYARLVLNDRDEIVGTAGTLNDITSRKSAEQVLQKQRAAIEAAIDGVAILDEAERFTYLNPTHVEMFGYRQADELLGRTWRDLYSPQEIGRFEREVFPQLQQRGKWRGAVTATRRDGSSFAEEVSLTAIEGGGLVCVCRDITDRLAAEQRIQASLQEKEVMLKEIHHRVKNNMQVVSSLLNLQLEHLEDPAARIQFMESQNRIASMALVHEKLYQSSDLARIDFNEYLRDLTDHLVGALGTQTRSIAFELKSADVRLSIDTAIPCGLIINELVSNAYKHAFPNGGPGRVKLTFEQAADGRFKLEVSDNGRGIPPGVDLKKSRSLGIQLVHTLVQQLRGTLEVHGENGTRFVLFLREIERKQSTHK